MDSSEHDIDATERVPMWFEDDALAEGSAPVLFPHASALGRGTPERQTLRYMGSTPARPTMAATIPAVAVGPAVVADRPASASASFEIEVQSPVIEPASPVVEPATSATKPPRTRPRPVRATPAVDVPPMPTFGAAMLKAHKRSGKPVAPVFVPPAFVAPPRLPPAVPIAAFAPTLLAITAARTTAKSTSFGATMLRDFYALLVVMAGSAVLFVAAYFIAGR
jgi:hypothetical protein